MPALDFLLDNSFLFGLKLNGHRTKILRAGNLIIHDGASNVATFAPDSSLPPPSASETSPSPDPQCAAARSPGAPASAPCSRPLPASAGPACCALPESS